jgi:hypothetical protein
MQKDGNIYGHPGRGYKCVCVQYIQAARKSTKVGGWSLPDRFTVVGSDEEVGGGEYGGVLESNIRIASIALALDFRLLQTRSPSSRRGSTGGSCDGGRSDGTRRSVCNNTAVEQVIELANKANSKETEAVGLCQHENCAHAGGCER